MEELAGALGLTDNAIRAHLATLERDGLVVPQGVRRGPGAGKPAHVYALGPEVAVRLSRAYAPVLAELADGLVQEIGPDRTEGLMRAAERRLAATRAGTARSLEQRVGDAVGLLNELGGDVTATPVDGGFRVRGNGCPLSAAVSRRPETCQAIRGLLAEVVGAEVARCCEEGPHPRCCFTVSSAA